MAQVAMNVLQDIGQDS